MLVETSRGLILILGLLVCSMSIFGLAATDRLLGLVRGVMDRSWGMVSAIGVRLVMGAALIIAAPVSRFPLVFEVIGWIALAAAVALPFIGRQRIRLLMDWVARQSSVLVRVWLIFGVAFGGFLVYGIG